MNKFKDRLHELRKSKKLTGVELGKLLGVSRVTVSHWESGTYQPSLEQLTALASVFNVSIDYLVGLDVFPNNSEPLPESIRKYLALSPDQQKQIDLYIDFVTQTNKK